MVTSTTPHHEPEIGLQPLPMRNPHVHARKIRAAYLTAVLTTALLGIFIYVEITTSFSTLEKPLNSITIHAGQRMNLYRSAMLLSLLTTENEVDERENLRLEIRSVLDQLEVTHQQFSHQPDELPPEVYQIYFDAPYNLNENLQPYIQIGRSLTAPSTPRLLPDNPDLQQLLDLLPNLRESFTSLIDTYKNIDAGKIATSKKNGVLLLGGLFVVLGLEIAFIFRPMELEILHEHANLLSEIERRQQSEAALKQSEMLYRLLADNISDMVTLHQPDGRFIYASPSYTHLTGYSSDELMAMPAAELRALVHPEDLPRTRDEAHQQVLQGKTITRLEYRGRRKDGTYFWVETDSRSIKDEQGTVTQLLASSRDITERRRIEEVLKEQQGQLEDFFTVAPDLLCIADTDGYFLKLNQFWEATLGYPLRELEGKRFLDFVHPDDLQATLDALSTLDAQQPILNFTNRYRCQDGTYRVIEWRSRSDGKLIYAAARDITERTQAEEALRQSEAHLRSLIDSQTAYIVRTDMSGHYTYVNPQFIKDYGWVKDNGNVIGLLTHETILPEDHQKTYATVAKCLAEPGKPVQVTLKKPTKDGDSRWTLWEFVAITNEQDEPTEIQCIGFDISAQMIAEEALRQSEERFRTISEIVTSYTYGYSVLADGGLEREWTAGAFKDITGYTPEEIDERGGWASLLYPDDLPLAAHRYKTLLSGQAAVDEFRIINRSNEVCWLRDYANPIWDEQEQRVTYIFGAAQDITEQKLSGAQAIELTLEREKVRLLADFVRDTSHDFRTPLSVINTSTHLIRKTDDPERRIYHLNKINAQVDYLSRIISALHLMASLDQDKMNEISPINFNQLIVDGVGAAQALIGQHQHMVHLDLEADLPKIRGDARYLFAAIAAILHNAFIYTPKGGEITIRSSTQDQSIIFEVADTGIGIGEADLPHIFNRFYKADSARGQNDSGTGLGLAITKKIIESHHGTIAVESELGKGSTFRIVLPLHLT